MSKKRLYSIIAISVLITAVVTFYATTLLYVSFMNDSGVKYSKLNKIQQIIDQYYYEDYDEADLADGAAYGMVAALGDPYTSYMNKDEWDDFSTMMNGTYSGIGVTVTANQEDNTIIVISVFSDSPAEKAGIVTGDKIIAVKGETVTGDKMDLAVAQMKGTSGTDVDITVLKANTGKAEDITLTRQEITMDTVVSQMEGEFGYIGISMFDMKTGDEFNEHLKSVMDQGAKGLILDLRQNGGGVTLAAEAVADSLLGKDKVIYYTKDKNGKEVHYKTGKEGIDLPIVVLVDEGTASASEILSAAIKDHNKGVLVGKKTFGKGLVQQTLSLGDGSVVKVTIEKYFTPSGVDINLKGIEPDYEVDFNAESETDTQLDKAIEVLKEQVK